MLSELIEILKEISGDFEIRLAYNADDGVIRLALARVIIDAEGVIYEPIFEAEAPILEPDECAGCEGNGSDACLSCKHRNWRVDEDNEQRLEQQEG